MGIKQPPININAHASPNKRCITQLLESILKITMAEINELIPKNMPMENPIQPIIRYLSIGTVL